MELVCCLFFLIASSQPSLYTASPEEAFRLPPPGIQMWLGLIWGTRGTDLGQGWGWGQPLKSHPLPWHADSANLSLTHFVIFSEGEGGKYQLPATSLK